MTTATSITEGKKRAAPRRKGKLNPLARMGASLLLAGLMAPVLTVTAWAAPAAGAGTGITEVDAMFDSVMAIIYGIARFGGVAVSLFGLIQIGMSVSSHDSSQRVTGFLAMAGGVIILFSPTIINTLAG